MATPFVDVYDYFLTKVEDYNFIELNKTGDLENVLFKYLRSSVIRFTASNTDLTYDTDSQSFVSDLDSFEMEILATYMVMQYSLRKILNIRNMEQVMTDKEYKLYSQANHLSQLLGLQSELQHEVSQLETKYSYKNGLGDLI